MEKNIKNPLKKIVQPLLLWYAETARELPWRRDKEPYHVWLSEIMLQQTRVEAVKQYYLRFMAQLPTIKALAEAEEAVLLKLWEGLGYYNRVRNIQKAAKVIMEQYGGVFPGDYEAIHSLPGIGDYTAGAIASICFEQPTPAVDGNVLRVISRLTNDARCVDLPLVKREITEKLREIYPKTHRGDFTQALMELGAIVCVPNGEPKCSVCPLQKLCLAKQQDTWDQIPLKAKKKARRLEELTVFIFRCGGKLALRKRTQPGVLSGMLELPNTAGFLSETEMVKTAKAWGVSVSDIELCAHEKHVFTHIEWHMRCYFVTCRAEGDAFLWASENELNQQYALPSAFKKILRERQTELPG